MEDSTPVTLKPGLTLDAERSALFRSDLDSILDSTDLDISRKCFAVWQRVQDWTGHAVSGQPIGSLHERLEGLRREEYPDESAKARLIRAIIFQALERNLDSDIRQGSVSATLSLIGDTARLGWGWGSVRISELGDRFVSVSAMTAIETDEIGVSTQEELTGRLERLVRGGSWLKHGALAGSAIPVLYVALFDLFVRAATVQADRKAANTDDLSRAVDALNRTVGHDCERLVRLSGHGLAAMLLDNLMQRPAIVASLTRLGRK